MAVWHNEKALMMVEVNACGTQDLKRRGVQGIADQTEGQISSMIPGCACGSFDNVIYGAYLAAGCCLCTAGISSCCYYCFCTKPLQNNAQHLKAQSNAVAAQGFMDKVLKSVRKILLDGPSDTLKLQTKELQAPGAAHDHL